MSKGSVKAIARQLNWDCCGGIAFGRYKGIFANISSVALTGTIIFTVNELKPGTLGELRKFIDQNRKRLCIHGNVRFEKPHLTIRLDSRFGVLTKKRLLNTFEEIAAYLYDNGTASACALCGGEGASPAATVLQVYFLCDSCFEKKAEEARITMEKRGGEDSYLKGLSGALCGGLAGLVPWAVFGLLGVISAVSGLFMAAFCTGLYKKFGGRMAKGMTPIVLAVLFVFTALGVVAANTILYLQEGYTDFALIMTSIFSNLTLDGITADFLAGLVLAGLGAFGIIRAMIRKASGRDVRIRRLRDLDGQM